MEAGNELLEGLNGLLETKASTCPLGLVPGPGLADVAPGRGAVDDPHGRLFRGEEPRFDLVPGQALRVGFRQASI